MVGAARLNSHSRGRGPACVTLQRCVHTCGREGEKERRRGSGQQAVSVSHPTVHRACMLEPRGLPAAPAAWQRPRAESAAGSQVFPRLGASAESPRAEAGASSARQDPPPRRPPRRQVRGHAALPLLPCHPLLVHPSCLQQGPPASEPLPPLRPPRHRRPQLPMRCSPASLPWPATE